MDILTKVQHSSLCIFQTSTSERNDAIVYTVAYDFEDRDGGRIELSNEAEIWVQSKKSGNPYCAMFCSFSGPDSTEPGKLRYKVLNGSKWSYMRLQPTQLVDGFLKPTLMQRDLWHSTAASGSLTTLHQPGGEALEDSTVAGSRKRKEDEAHRRAVRQKFCTAAELVGVVWKEEKTIELQGKRYAARQVGCKVYLGCFGDAIGKLMGQFLFYGCNQVDFLPDGFKLGDELHPLTAKERQAIVGGLQGRRPTFHHCLDCNKIFHRIEYVHAHECCESFCNVFICVMSISQPG